MSMVKVSNSYAVKIKYDITDNVPNTLGITDKV